MRWFLWFEDHKVCHFVSKYIRSYLSTKGCVSGQK
ncbi:retrotransposon hot spot (RHS) protein, putative, partial [Trypanosoma cruzi]